MPNNIDNVNIPTINANTFSIYDKLVETFKAVTGNSLSDIDFLSSSLIDYVTQGMAMIYRDSILDRNMTKSENFLNTASKPESIYNFARTFNVAVSHATPAHMKSLLIIRKADIITNAKPASFWGNKYFANNGRTSSNTELSYFIIDRDNPLYADNIPFSLERSIIISVAKPSTVDYKYSISASYCINEPELTAYNSSATRSPFIKSRTERDGTEEYFGMTVDLYQYEKTIEEKYIATNNILENKVHAYSYKDQLCKIIAYYRQGNSPDLKINLEFNQTSTIPTELCAKYNMTSDDTYEIIFLKNTANAATLKANMYLKVITITTLGAAGNFNYTGYLNYKFDKDELKNVQLVAKAYQETDGGSDTPSLKQVKNDIISFISSRNAIVTEADLNKYFSSISYDAQTTGGNISFVKKRDDLIRRIFSAYLLLKDAEGGIIPTNTVNAVIELSDAEGASAQFSKDPGCQVVFNNEKFDDSSTLVGKDKYRFTETNPIFTADGADPNIYYMPFYLMVRTTPVPLCKYIYNSCSESVSLKLTSLNHSFVEDLTPLTVSVHRNALLFGEKRYTITMSFSSSMTAAELQDFNVTTIIGDASNSEKYTVTHTFNELKPDGNGAYEITDYLTVSDNEFNTGGTSLNINTNNKVFSLLSDVIIGFSVTKNGTEFIRGQAETPIVFFDNLENIMTSDLIIKKEESVAYNQKGWLMDVADDPNTFIKYTSDNVANPDAYNGLYYPLTVVKKDSVSNVLTITITEADGTTTTLTMTPKPGEKVMTYSKQVNQVVSELIVKSAPVVHTSFSSEENISTLSQRINRYIKMLQSNSDKLEPSTTFDLKFYNTRGRSYLTSAPKTNLDIKLNVYTKDIDVGNSTLEKDIRTYTAKFIENSNTVGIFSVTKLISELVTVMASNIAHIDFVSLNSAFDQKVEIKPSLSKLSEVPEHLNLGNLTLNFKKIDS